MYLNSIVDLHKEVQKTRLYKSKGPEARSILIDRCNYLVHMINSGNRKHKGDQSKFDMIPIHSDTLQQQLGRNYTSILYLLERLKYININHSYLAGADAEEISKSLGVKVFPEAKKYGLTSNAKKLKIEKVGVLSKWTEKRILAYKKEHIEKVISDKVNKKIIDNLYQVRYDGEAIEIQWKSKDQENYYQKTFEDLNRFKDLSFNEFIYDHNFYYAPSKYGRKYHYFATMPKVYFESLKHKDGSKLSEIDLRQAQPFIIALMYAKQTGDTDILKDFVDQDWYKLIADISIKNGHQGLGSLYYSDRTKFKTTIIADAFYSRSNNKEPMQVLKKIYPEFAAWIVDYKTKHGYKSISQNAQNVESTIFIDGFFNLVNGFAIPKHDSILCRTDDMILYKQILIKVMQKKFSFVDPSLFQNVFKVNSYE